MQSYARKHIAEASYHIMLSCLADTYYRMGKKDSAICYEKKSVEASVALRDSFYLFGSYRALGMYYRTLGNMDSSLVYYGKALELSLSRNEKKLKRYGGVDCLVHQSCCIVCRYETEYRGS